MKFVFFFMLIVNYSQLNKPTDDIGQEIDSLFNQFTQQIDSASFQPIIKLIDDLRETQPDRSKALAQLSLDFSTKNDFVFGIAESYGALGRLLVGEGEYENSVTNLKKALSYYHLHGNRVRMGDIYNSLGIAFRFLGDFDAALKWNLKSLRIREEMDDWAVVHNYYTIGTLYKSLRYFDKSKEYYIQCIEKSKEDENNYLLAKTYNALGNIYSQTNDLDQATQYYKQSLSVRSEYNLPGSQIVNANLSLILTKRNKFNEALLLVNRALAENIKLGRKKSMVLNLEAIARNLLYLNQLSESEENALNALSLAKEIEFQESVIDLSFLLSEIYAAKGNYIFSNKYRLQYEFGLDSMVGADLKEKIAEIQTKYELKKKENELVIQKQRNELTKQSSQIKSYIIAIIIVSAVLVIYLIWIRKKMVQNRLDTKRRELASKAMQYANTVEFVNHLKEQLAEPGLLNQNNLPEDLKKRLDAKTNREKEWESFMKHFEEVHPKFYTKLRKRSSQLTPNELRLCAYIKIGLSNKEIASILNTSAKSTEMAKYRLKKSLNLLDKQTVVQFVNSI